MIGVGAEGMDGLLEGDLDLEADAIGLDDGQGGQRPVGAQQDFAAARGMGDEHKAHGDAHGAPEQIKHTVAQGDAGLP